VANSNYRGVEDPEAGG